MHDAMADSVRDEVRPVVLQPLEEGAHGRFVVVEILPFGRRA